MTNLSELTITTVKKGFEKGEFSVSEITEAYLKQIKALDTRLDAYLYVNSEKAHQQAKEADMALTQNRQMPLFGIPYSLKDIFLTKDIPTTAGSHVLESFIPPYSATSATKLANNGAIILGKNNLDAWAHGSSGENTDFNPTKNPYNTAYTPGGSSSGPAVAVAADMALFSTGTDTGGSIRLPASFCNIVGLKPTYGRVSRYGVVAMASSFDSIGHFTKTVEDSALVLQVTAGQDPLDPTTPNKSVPDYVAEMKKDIKGLRIGLPKEYFEEGLDPKIAEKIHESVQLLEKQGAIIKTISLPNTKYAISIYYIIQTAEVSSNLGRYDAVRYGNGREKFGDEAKRRIMLGTFTLSAGYYDAYYKKAAKVRTLIRQDFEKAFHEIDVLITPTSPTLPWKLKEKADNPLAMYLSDIYTVTANVAGIPGISVPAGFLNDLPVGLQLLGPQFREDLLFRVGYHLEKETEYWKKKPKIEKL